MTSLHPFKRLPLPNRKVWCFPVVFEVLEDTTRVDSTFFRPLAPKCLLFAFDQERKRGLIIVATKSSNYCQKKVSFFVAALKQCIAISIVVVVVFEQ